MLSLEDIKTNILSNKFSSYKEKILKIKNNNNKIYIPDDKINILASDLQKLNYMILLINGYADKKMINTKGFLKKLTQEINIVTGFQLTNVDTFNLLEKAITVKINLNNLSKEPNFQSNLIEMKGGFFGWDDDTDLTTKALDVSTVMLDVLGMVPAAGIAADGLNILINLLRQKFVMAGIGLISLVPIIGTVGPALKIGYNLYSSKDDDAEDDGDNDDEEYEEDEEYEDDE